MNAAIASASLLGFGDRPASIAFQEFGITLNNIYTTQQKQLKEETSSRKSVTDEYNKERRSKKKSQSDLADILSGLNKTNSGRSKSGAKNNKNSNIMSKILLGAGVALAGKALYDAVSTQVFEGVKETVEDMVDPIMEVFEEVFAPIKNFFGSGEDGGGEDTAPASGAVPSTGVQNGSTRGSTGKTQAKEIDSEASNKERYKIIYDVAKSQGDPIPELTAAQAMFESNYLRSTLAMEGNNPFGQSGSGDDGKVDYENASIVSSTTGWAKYSSIETAITARIKRWSKKTPQGNPGYGTYKSPMEAMEGIIENYAPAKDSNNHANYLGGVEGIMKANGHNPHRKLAKGGFANGKKSKKKRKIRKGNGPKSEDTIAQGKINPIKRQKGGKIFLHWAATGYDGASPNYHATIQGDGSVEKTRDYNTFGGGHTYRQNSEGIGISLAAMAGASTENFGKYPVKQIQYENMAKLCAQILTSWGHGPSYVNDRTVPTHAEAGRDLPGDNYGPVGWGGDGNKWDLWKLYENDANGSGGPKIRNMIKGYMASAGTIKLESEDAPNYVDSPSSSTTSAELASPGGAMPSAPTLPPPPKTFDQAIDDIASQALAPLLGLLGALSGSSLPSGQTTQEAQPTSSSPGAAGAVSITNPNARALLNAISDAEGTSGQPNNGYNTMFTGKQFNNLSDHPRARQSGGGHTSDAAGRYQFLSTTWDSYANGRDMSPANQDAVALDLVAKKQGVDISDGLSKNEVYKLGREWASIEGGASGIAGGSYGGQAKYSADRFLEMYKAYGGQVQGLQKGGVVGQQINTGKMRGIQNAHMSKLRDAQQRMKRKGPKVIQVTLPPIPSKEPTLISQEDNTTIENSMRMSQLADFNRRLAMGALT